MTMDARLKEHAFSLSYTRTLQYYSMHFKMAFNTVTKGRIVIVTVAAVVESADLNGNFDILLPYGITTS